MQHTACSSYYSEVTSPSIRTAVHCMAGVFNCLGLLLPVVAARLGVGWRLLCLIVSVVPLLGFVHIFTVPESPAWLVMNGNLKEALRAILRLRGPGYNHAGELEYLERSYDSQAGNHAKYHILKRLKDPDVWKSFVIVNLLFIIQVWTGLGTISNYIISIIRATGTALNPYNCAIAVITIKIARRTTGVKS